jgi:hypothetical protein
MEISVKPGATLLNSGLTAPVKYAPASFFTNLSGRDFLPVGQYTLCYTLLVEINKNLTPAGKECLPVDIEPMTPPYLNYPFHQSVINEKNPRFVWIPPTPTQLFSALKYDFLLVEKQPEQTPEEAIQRNTPLMTIGNLPSNSFGYNGVGMSALDTGKQYAWQVIAKNGAAYGVKSEVWSFRVSIENETSISNEYMSLVKSEYLQPFLLTADRLTMKYYAYGSSSNGLIKVSDTRGKLIKKQSVNVVLGDNYFTLNIAGSPFKGNGRYRVELVVDNVIWGQGLFTIGQNNK